MRGYLTGFLLVIALSGNAQKRRYVVTDSATLSFMHWRLSTLRKPLWSGKTNLNMFAYVLAWQSMPLMSKDEVSAARIDTLIQQSLSFVHGSDTANYVEAAAKCWPSKKRATPPKPLFTQQDLQVIARSFEKQPGLVWPAAFPGFVRRKKLLPACCAFTRPVFCANGQIALQWEYVFGEEGLAIYQRVSAHEWCLLSEPHRIMY